MSLVRRACKGGGGEGEEEGNGQGGEVHRDSLMSLTGS